MKFGRHLLEGVAHILYILCLPFSTLQSSVGTLATKVSALSGIDSPFVGYFDAESKLPAQASPAWALVGDLTTVKPYAYYVNGSVPSGFNAGWNDLSGALGTYDFTNLDNCARTKDSTTDYDLSISDRIGNIIAAFKDGHFRTKNFDSSKAINQTDSTNSVDLEIADNAGNVIAAFKDGHFRTKNFDSKNIRSSNNSSFIKLRFLHWNIGHFNGGVSALPNMANEQVIDKHITAYRSLFNQSAADIIGLCEYSNCIDSNSSHKTKDSILPIYHNVLEGKIGTNRYVCSALYATDGIPFSGVNYVDFDLGYYGLYTKVDLEGKEIVFCELHTPFQTDEANLNANNILIEKFKDEPYVVLAGDFNTRPANVNGFKDFVDNGYEIINTPYSYIGDTPTYPSLNYPCIDNICVKGGTILNAKVIYELKIPNLIRKGSMDTPDGAYFDNSPITIKIGQNYVAEDGVTYNLSDHLPILCDITF